MSLVVNRLTVQPNSRSVSQSNNLTTFGTGAQNPRVVRFGSATHTTVNKFLLPTFQKLTEVFLWSFLGVDLLCLWVPRITNSLVTGAIPYDSRQDPSAQNLSFPRLAGRWVDRNFMGLNWRNLYEESKREIGSGPGTLAIPAVVFLGVRHVLNKRHMELSYHSIEGLCQGLEHHISKNPASQVHSRKAYTEQIESYINSIFTDPGLRKAPLIEPAAKHELADIRKTLIHILEHPSKLTHHELEQFQSHPQVKAILLRHPQLAKDLRDLLAPQKQAKGELLKQLNERPFFQLLREPGVELQTYDDYLKHWSKQWSDAAMIDRNNRSSRLLRHEKLTVLHEDLQDVLKNFNLLHRRQGYSLEALPGDVKGKLTDKQPIHNVDRTWIRYTSEQWSPIDKKFHAKPSVQKDVQHLTGDLERWADFANDVWRTQGRRPQKNIPTLIDSMRKRLIVQKLGLSVFSTVLACGYMVHLAFWAQNYGTYQANRLLKGQPSKTAKGEGINA